MTLVVSHKAAPVSPPTQAKENADLDYLDPLFPELMSLDDAFPTSFHQNDIPSPSSSANDSNSSTTTPSPTSQYDMMPLEKTQVDMVSALPDSYHQLTSDYYTRSHLYLGNASTTPTPGVNLSSSPTTSLGDEGLHIRVHGVPNIGAKSRVETQIKLCVQLQSAAGKVHNWSYLRLDEHLLARSKLRKSQQQKQQLDGRAPSMVSDESKVLSLSARVVCSTNPTKLVKMCLGCVRRERKRAERTKDGKPRYEADATGTVEEIMERDRSRILVFNCTRMLNFSSGDAILPTRITCYCRHHNEKIGFRIEFVLHDHQGTIVATGSSPPIMITDDHKSSRQRDETPTLARKRGRSEDDLPGAYHAAGSTIPPDTPASSRRNSLSSSTNVRSSMSSSSSSSSSSSHLAADAAAIAEQPTPSTSLTSSPQQVLLGSELAMTPMDELSFLQQMNDTSSPLAMTQLLQQQQQQQQQQQHHQLQQQHQYQQHQQQQPPSALPIHPTAVMEDQELWPANRRRRIAGNNTATNNGYDAPPLWRTEYTPQLERLVPAQGPTYGGIEITVLGTGFYRGLTCLFGEHAANTVYWNPNTLVCVLPPAATPGPVVVSFKEHPIVLEGQDVALFTYYDASDQALLELALQVVGIKMTGKLMDAKQIAMMIVRGDQQRIQQQQQQQQQQSQNQQQNQQQLQSLQMQELAGASDDALTDDDNDDDEDYDYDYDSDASSVASSDVQDLSLENDEHLSGAQLEKHVMDALLASDCVDVTQTNTKGHTLLHLAVLLQFGALVKVLLARMTPGVIDRADRNGCTALQFACLQNNAPMVSLLLQAGASIGHDCSIGGTMDLATDPAVRAVLEQHQRQRPMPLSRNVSFKSHVRRFYRLKSSDTRTSTTNDDQQALDDTGLGFAQAKFDRRLYAFWLPLLIVTIGFLYYQILGDRTLMNLLQDIIPFRQRGLTSIVGY